MCIISTLGDQHRDRWFPPRNPPTIPVVPPIAPYTTTYSLLPDITRAEFDALKQEVEELKRLLIAAKAQDIADGNADCEMEDKIAVLKRVAELVGVDLDEVFG